jgi:hypothetical protein
MSSFGIKLLAVLLAIVATAAVAQEKPASPILFTNVNIFDGKNKTLIEDATDFDRFVAEVGVDASAIGGKNGRSPARAASSAPPTEHADSSDFERFVAAVGADAATIGDELERAGKFDPMGAELMAMIFCPMHLRMESRGAPLDPFDPFASVASQIDQRLIEVSQPASGGADKPDPSRQD